MGIAFDAISVPSASHSPVRIATRDSFHNETIGEVQRQTEQNPDAERIGHRWV